MPAQLQSKNKKIIGKLLILVAAMFGFGFALVPLYNVFCDVTGLNGKTDNEKAVYSKPPVIDKDRLITIQFITSLNEQMPWEFKPMTSSVTVHPGESTKVEFYVRNVSHQDIVGQAIPSIAPGLAAGYFQKSECFCFTEQTLKAGESRLMPVVFIVDSSIPKDFNDLTLSYTFFVKKSTEAVIKHPLAIQHNQEN